MPLYLDDTTLMDLSIFEANDGNSIFIRFNATRTQGGERYLQQYFATPFNDFKTIQAVQSLIATFAIHVESWPTEIGNGTVFMMEKFLKYRFSHFNANIHFLDRLIYMVTERDDYSMMKFSTKVLGDFFRGIKKIYSLIRDLLLPVQYRYIQDKMGAILEVEAIKKLAGTAANHTFTSKEIFYYCFQLRLLRTEIHDLMDIYFRLEAWFSMAKAVKDYGLTFPKFVDSEEPYLNVKGLYHLMVEKPKSSDVLLDNKKGLMFLTGSNMAGKSTLIKAVGLSIYLSHLGMGVPAASMTLSTFDGLLTNINIADDVTKGQSYFFKEVLRVKDTIGKIKSGKKWMILVDELFKGTNIIDAMQCSIDVIDGFSKVKNALFVISTHLYEIADNLQHAENVIFKHMETIVDGDQFCFTYQLIDGVSNERIGHRIMKQEGVVKMLREL
jgi:DNA mismatch repair ATPase MutS